jgi:stage III sporulation protein AE
MRRILVLVILAIFLFPARTYAAIDAFDTDAQLDALGREEIVDAVPGDAKERMAEAGLNDFSVGELLQLSPKEFFAAIWQMILDEAGRPLRTLGVILAVVILSAMLRGLVGGPAQHSMAQVFATVAVLCLLTSVVTPILDCVVDTSAAIESASNFMLTFIPVFSAALTAAGQPVTGAVYNMFLFSACQVVAQVVAGTLIPLLGVYLAICVVGVLAPELHIDSATKSVRSIVSWSLGFLTTGFVGLLSVQTMVSGSADGVTARATRFLIGSFVPVVGGVLSEAVAAARGCLRLIKTSVGAYGILAAAFIFLPILLRALLWYVVTGVSATAGDLLGVGEVSTIMRSCSSALGILIAVVICFALLIIVSTTVVMVTGLGTG